MQKFVFEVLRKDFSHLHQFSTGGKDGGIDLCNQKDQCLEVFECKYIGKDDDYDSVLGL